MTIQRTFQLEKETKGTWRYQEAPLEGAAPAIGVLYVRKGTFPTRPETLTVTLEAK